MATPQASTSRHVSADRVAQEVSAALLRYLSPHCFPATRDELQATLVRHHAPAQLLWELNRLSASRRYDSLEKVHDELEQPARPSLPREPI